MIHEQKVLIEILSSANDGYSHRSLAEELISRGIAPASASQHILEALSSGILLEHGDEQIYLSPEMRRGW